MPLPRVSLGSFLSAGKAALKTSPISPVTFVIGNESADLDSLCSAVVLAYLRTYAQSSKSNTFYIPLSNIPQADLSIRPELLPVLSRANLKPSDLITLSDLPRVGLSAENTSWVLVDHNSLQGELGEQYGKSVKGCVDHHIEENKVPQDTEDEPRIVKKCGSCTSLVVEYCKEAWDALSTGSKTKSEGTEVWDKELAYLALGPVLIDTSNLQDKSQTTEVDIAVVKYLESKIRVVNGEQQFNPEAYFKEIAGAKRDVSGIDVTGLLRKDYKQWSENSTNLGIASVMTNIKTLIEKAGNQQKFMNICKEFAEERGLSILTVMTKSSSDGQFRRELFVWGIDQKGAETVKAFGESSKDDLNLAKHSEESLNFEGDKEWRRCWQQDRLDYTRKQVAPMMRTAMRGDK